MIYENYSQSLLKVIFIVKIEHIIKNEYTLKEMLSISFNLWRHCLLKNIFKKIEY